MLLVRASSVLHALVLTAPVIFLLSFFSTSFILLYLQLLLPVPTLNDFFLFLWDMSVLHLPLYILVGKQVAINFTGICIFQQATRQVAREGNGTPLQYSCLENPVDGGAWQAVVHGVAKSRTRLSDFTFTFHFHALEKEKATHSSVLA